MLNYTLMDKPRKGVVSGLKKKLTLYGFNNLTKSLSFNIYDVCYTESERDKREYIAYIDEQYNSDRLTKILCKVADIIGAHILNISKQDYEPQGASVNLLIAEEQVPPHALDETCNLGLLKPPKRDTVHAHLDKSHITVHTYPESHPDVDVSTFRVDVDVSTCGVISPLNALNFLIGSFDSDIITIDYRVRGFTRDTLGNKLYIDHPIRSIQDYIDTDILRRYDAVDMNVYQSNTFHTKMLIRDIDLNNYLFSLEEQTLPGEKRQDIIDSLRREMTEIFYGMSLFPDRPDAAPT